jgi:hypothetical protein
MSLCRGRSDSGVTNLFAFSFILLCYSIVVSGQQSQYPILANVDSAEVWFDQIVNPQNAALVNGPVYSIPFKGYNSHPFYKSPESDRSFVHYDNDLYRNVDLLYDSYSDILVFKCATDNSVYFIKMDPLLVQNFDLHNHHFKKYNEGISAGLGPYFDVLFEEKQFAVVVKRLKAERFDGRTRYYEEDNVHYILNSGKWTRITGTGSFSKQLRKDQRKELATFIKSNHINVRKRRDEDLSKLGAFCYSLIIKK